MDRSEVDSLCTLFTGFEYPGNNAIPEEPSYYYTYAGEMPFVSIPGQPVTDEQEHDRSENTVSADSWSDGGIVVEIPIQRYSWESYHSAVNDGGSACLPSKRLCEALSLRYRANKWDLHDTSGLAPLYREVGEYGSQISGSFSYLRRDLLDSYLTQSDKALVWLMWGECGFHHRPTEARNLNPYYANHQHIHKRTHVYKPASSN